MKAFVQLTLALGLIAMMLDTAHAAEFTMKVSLSNGPKKDHYIHTPLLNFEKEVERESGGRIDVKFFWNFALGKHEKVLNLVRQGVVESVCASEGHMAPYYPDAQVLGIPYLFVNRQVAYEVLDGPFGQNLADRMAKATGIRPLVWFENAGYRHFSANRPLKTVDDLKGLKMRTMTTPVHMEIVRSLGMSPTPIGWADLYTALQTGVVDGQENALGTFRVPKLEEVQKYIILDGHVYSILGFFTSEKWLKKLPADLRKVLMTAAGHALQANRIASQKNFEKDRAYLEGAGVSIYEPSVETKQAFKRLTQKPALEILRKEVDPSLLNDLLETVKEAEAKSNS